MNSWWKILARLNLVVCLYHLRILLRRAQQAMLVRKQLAKRAAVLGITTVSLIMELRLQEQIKKDGRGLLRQRMDIDKFIICYVFLENHI